MAFSIRSVSRLYSALLVPWAAIMCIGSPNGTFCWQTGQIMTFLSEVFTCDWLSKREHTLSGPNKQADIAVKRRRLLGTPAFAGDTLPPVINRRVDTHGISKTKQSARRIPRTAADPHFRVTHPGG